MRHLQSPQEAYRRVDFDARVSVSSPADLVHLCVEQLVGAVGSAIYAFETHDNALKSRSLTRALASVTALQIGVTGDGPMAMALHQMYEAARRTLLDSATDFDSNRMANLRRDFVDIGQSLKNASSNSSISADNSN